MSIVLLACSLLLSTRVWAATVVFGNVSETWTTNGSPYILSADCTVASNQTLTIQPGVTVIIPPDTSILVNGGIAAIGTPEQPITIRGVNVSSYWTSIQMTHNGFTNKFRYCRISEGYDALSITVSGGNRTMTAEIIDCDFLNCRNTAILGQASGYPSSGPPGSLVGSATLAPQIHNCVFERINFACYFTANYMSYNPNLPPGDAYVNPLITGNLFKNLGANPFGYGLFLDASYNNFPSTNVSRPVFVNNTVVRSLAGVYAHGPVFETIVRNNIFADNGVGLFRSSVGTAVVNASYNCFFGNIENFSGYPGAYGIPLIANHNGDPCDAFFNIMLDPRFLETNTFRLSNSSPCVDAGDPAIADVCFDFSHGLAISDIGAYGGPDACGWLTHGFAPVITGGPADQSSCVGGNAVFKVRVEGSEPFSYRWYFNGTNLLAGETNAQLTLANLQTSQAGLYSVAVSNTFSSVASAPARLLVFDACVGIHLYAGLSITGIVGRTYAVEAATNLNAVSWTLLATNTFTSPQWLFIDTNTPFNPSRYFRVRLKE